MLAQDEESYQAFCSPPEEELMHTCPLLEKRMQSNLRATNDASYQEDQYLFTRLCGHAPSIVPSATGSDVFNLCSNLSHVLSISPTNLPASFYASLCAKDQGMSFTSKRDFCTQLKALLQQGGTYTSSHRALYYGTCYPSPAYRPERAACQLLRTTMLLLLNSSAPRGPDEEDARRAFLSRCNGDREVPPVGMRDPVLQMGSYLVPFRDIDLQTEDGFAVLELCRRGILVHTGDVDFDGERGWTSIEAIQHILDVCRPSEFLVPRLNDAIGLSAYATAALRLNLLSLRPAEHLDAHGAVSRADVVLMFAKACNLHPTSAVPFVDLAPLPALRSLSSIAGQYPFFDTDGVHFEPFHLVTRTEGAVALYRYLEHRKPWS
ncbi:hypothetical protein HY213_04740 [Candidatus Peregrinibacteria bacterium]|nr:hypothetical protein [Candidatus Peregrinibacteria bacterium]